MHRSASTVRRFVAWCIFAVSALFGDLPTASAQQAAVPEHATPLPAPVWRAAFPHRSAFGSLCALGPLACALIDRPFALSARLELFVRPKAPDGSTALLVPFALSVPLFGRAEVGLSSCHASFWASGSEAAQLNADPSLRRPAGLCPLTLSGKLLLFPWLRDPHHSGALSVEYQLELRAGPFNGGNQLGLPGPLSKISLAYRQPRGRLELSGAASVLVDHQSRAGTLQLGAHVGYRLPVGEHFSVFGQAMAQVPSWGPVLVDPAGGPTLNLAPPVAGTLAVGLQQRADFGFGAGLTLLLTKSEVDTRLDLLFRLLSFELGPHIKPLWRARETPPAAPKAAVALVQPTVTPACPAAGCAPATPPPKPAPSPLFGHPCYLAPLDGSPHLRMGFIDSTGQYCDWDGLRLPLGAVISPPDHTPPDPSPPQPAPARAPTAAPLPPTGA